ncbi:MAG TPA: hypothetical protein VND15_00205 [Candidatus Acidoferrales bacterium]|nr:hypothetical protein [Candidatus Acidoferrales bacterium]
MVRISISFKRSLTGGSGTISVDGSEIGAVSVKLLSIEYTENGATVFKLNRGNGIYVRDPSGKCLYQVWKAGGVVGLVEPLILLPYEVWDSECKKMLARLKKGANLIQDSEGKTLATVTDEGSGTVSMDFNEIDKRLATVIMIMWRVFV